LVVAGVSSSSELSSSELDSFLAFFAETGAKKMKNEISSC